ncbi:MAG: Tic22 family protein [Limnoraphis robusta]|nr:Tic22 family protein [Limnoraphis robusta]
MMKLIARLSVVFGIVGSHLLINPVLPPGVPGFFSMGIQPALALTPEQILEKLGAVPVFTITDAEGSPLVGTAESGGQSASVVEVYISRQDAQAFINKLKTENPQLASSVQVTAVPLGKIYEIGQQNQNNPERLMFAFVPTQQQLNSAKSVLQANGQDINQFRGVPLFIARAGADDRVITVQQGDKQAIPFFFTKEDLQGMLEQFKTQQPDLISSVKIEVVPLEVLLEAFRTDNDQFLDLVILIPPRETVEYIQQQRQSSGGR